MRTELMGLRENFDPVVEQANGFRRKLEDEGWSPAVAEAAAAEMLVGMMRCVFTSLNKTAG